MTLIEVILFIVIVSVGLTGVLSSFNIATARSADPMVRKQALTVAEQMMEEILLKDFANPDGGFVPATSGNPTQAERPSFDNVGDYHMAAGWSWVGVRDMTGTAVAGLEGYTVTVQVVATAFGVILATDASQITVTVAAGAETVTLTGFRTRY